jgi:hypothetical protein
VPTDGEIISALSYGSEFISSYNINRQIQGNAYYSSMYNGTPAGGIYTDSSALSGTFYRYWVVMTPKYYSNTTANGWVYVLYDKDWLKTPINGPFYALLIDDEPPVLNDIEARTPAGTSADTLNKSVSFSIYAQDNQYLSGAVWEIKPAGSPDSAYTAFRTQTISGNYKTQTFTANM